MKPVPQVPMELADYVSHRLRSPLNGIKVWAQILSDSLDRQDESNARRAVRGIFECVQSQAGILDELLAAGERHSAETAGSNSDTTEDRMPESKRTHANDQDQKRNRTAEHPQRPETEPDTMEGPGGRHQAQGEEDSAKNQTTRRGER